MHCKNIPIVPNSTNVEFQQGRSLNIYNYRPTAQMYNNDVSGKFGCISS